MAEKLVRRTIDREVVTEEYIEEPAPPPPPGSTPAALTLPPTPCRRSVPRSRSAAR
jgi:hypothetical protein